jgi:hypothetical protein
MNKDLELLADLNKNLLIIACIIIATLVYYGHGVLSRFDYLLDMIEIEESNYKQDVNNIETKCI